MRKIILTFWFLGTQNQWHRILVYMVYHETNICMSHFFVILIQIPYIVLSLVCGISVIISNWNEFAVKKQPKTAYMVIESTEVEAVPDMDFVPMAA